MSAPRIVTLDGPAGVGKTTLARRVAEALGLAYLDTGAMFRATALALGPGARELPGAGLRARLEGLAFGLEGRGAASALRLNGRPVGEEIRTEQVGMLASDVATLPEVREFLKAAQRAVGRATALVAEGRDMGTVVFPEAAHKFFLDAAPEIRARRRCEQLRALGAPADLDAVTAQIRARDHQDRTRAVAPLRPAEDALVIDTGPLDIDGVFAAIMAALGRS
ncbi:(d)CMP kinase [Desulfocurvus sp.]|uniref:(d)CMP kinase n=1 Tax=Desulfocurvus sp. TaxID=2871698 RepID=UPI0025B90835|nr:(d)CMP kinase [Desulfocurvus sp.]MCK9241026.1 (d)CMP kinase [Desulfocurvus sp.]